MTAQALIVSGTAGADTLNGTDAYGDTLNGLAGNDTLNGVVARYSMVARATTRSMRRRHDMRWTATTCWTAATEATPWPAVPATTP